MQFLKGKKILITGLSHSKSIALGIAKSVYEKGAKLGFVCQNQRIFNKIKKLVSFMQPSMILICDISQDKQIKNLFFDIKDIWHNFDGLVHSIAYCPKKYLHGDFIKDTTRIGFNITHEISSYSFLGLIKECKNMLNDFSSLLTLSYIGSQKVVPNYHLMGLAKASLESCVRYMAFELGKHNIRVNAISPGPIKTISSVQIKNFYAIQKQYYASAFIKNNITIDNIGNIASFLLSDLSIGITGSIIHVDNGFHASSIN